MAWEETPQPSCPAWEEESISCGSFGGGFLLINDTDYLLINSSGDRLIIDPTLWNKVVTETC